MIADSVLINFSPSAMIARNKLFWFIADGHRRSAIVGDGRKLMFSYIASIARSSSAMIADGLRYVRTRLKCDSKVQEKFKEDEKGSPLRIYRNPLLTANDRESPLPKNNGEAKILKFE